jgi:predicted DNA-binding transcriptional regulator YafY
VYYNIDAIHAAIIDGKKISFKYFDYDLNKARVYRRDGERYTHTPLALCRNDDKYYMVCHNAKYDDFTHYRVDRMSSVSVCDERADKIDRRRFNIAAYIKRVFGMYGGGKRHI